MLPYSIIKKHIIVFFLLIMLPATLWAQTARLDSIEGNIAILSSNIQQKSSSNQVPNHISLKQDSIIIFDLIAQASKRIYNQKDSALFFNEQALVKSKAANYDYGLASAMMVKGDIHRTYSEYEKAQNLYDKSIDIFQKLNHLKSLSRVHTRIGVMEFIDGHTQKALEHYQLSKKMAEEAKDSLYIAASLMNMGGCHIKFGEYAKALPCYAEATEIFHLMGRTPEWGMGFHYIAQLYDVSDDNEKAVENIHKAEQIIKENTGSPKQMFNLGYVYLTKGSIYLNLKDSVKQLVNIGENMIKIGSQLQLPMVLGNGYLYKGVGHKKLEQRDSAIFFLHKGYDILLDNSFQSEVSSAALELGALYFESEEFDKAEKYLNVSLEIEKKDSKNIDELAKIYNYLSQIAKHKGDINEAYNYLELQRISKDSFHNKQTQELLAEVEAKYKTKEQEVELVLKETQITRQRNLNWGISALALLLLGFGLFAYYTARQRKKTNQLLSSQKSQLLSLDKAKSRFFTNISHELRTPLHLILAPLEVALKNNKNKGLQEDLKLARNNGKKLLTLVNEILDLSKLESGKLELKERPVHLKSLLRRLLFSYHSLAHLRGFMLSFEYEPVENFCILLDSGKFEKVINNLLSNAIKYSNPGGVITLKTKINGQTLTVEVIDQGKGIAPDKIEKIFDRFYQVEGEDEPLQGGTGVGLALARELVRVSGGQLKVKSILGEGSRFIITLPLKEVSPSAVENIPELEEKLIANEPSIEQLEIAYTAGFLKEEKPKILIVEDNPEMSQFLKRILSIQYDCTLAYDGEAALDIAKSHAFDLITSDVMMPNMDGFTFLKKIKQNSIHQQTPFILLTARALQEDKLKGLRLGVDDYITKPFQINELLARIENLLENKKQREEWLQQQKPTLKEETLENSSFDDQLIKTIESKVVENISNSKYTVEQLCKELNFSRRNAERLIKKLTGLSPLALIREVRLQKAQYYLLNRQFPTISEVAFEVGFDDPAYFSRMFVRRFGKKPSEVVGSR